ncbi:MAG: ABC transporter permease [Myxococcales bacterium]|nr:ABC transporter permease [Myxococcales bacterium]
MWLHPLRRKLFRDLTTLKGQIVTIALVVACGVAALVTMQSALRSLRDARETFYAASAFADVFVMLRRAPEAVGGRLADLPGVRAVDTRVVGMGTIPFADRSEPARVTVSSLPGSLGRLYLREGRLPEPGRNDEVVLSDAFAEANELRPGARVPLVVGGVRRNVQVVGVGLGPEHVIVMNVGDMAMDAKKSGVLWMNRDAAEAALDLGGSFNQAVLSTVPGFDTREVIDGVDEIVRRYGGLGAHDRERQMSDFMLSQELMQLENMSAQIPPLFLLVAAFLLHVVLTRLVQLQRGQIAALKALGYFNREILQHYLELASVIVVLGATLGVGFGAWFTREMIGLYEEYFRFPTLRATLDPQTAITAILVATLAGVLGTVTSVRSVLKLTPAAAMQPPAPARYRRGLLDIGFFSRLIGPSTRMILRELQRRPLRVALSALGIGVAVGLMVVARFFGDAMDYLVDVQLHESQRWDAQIAFAEPRPLSDLRVFESMPGVFRVQGLRAVPIRIVHEQRSRHISLFGHFGDPEHALQRVVGAAGVAFEMPADGVLLTDTLGDLLGVGPGDTVTLEILEGDRRTLQVPVAGLVDELFGLQAHASADTLHRWLGQEPSTSLALLSIDTAQAEALDRRFVALPDVIGVAHMARVLQQFREQSAQNIGVFSLILTLFGAVIAVGVVYNNARVALSMRERELASLRVLGFTRAEISTILLGELAVQVFAAIPIGLVLGRVFSEAMAKNVDPEMFRFPVILSTQTYAFAAVVTLASAFVSALLVRRKLDRLDLIGVLKTRE